MHFEAHSAFTYVLSFPHKASDSSHAMLLISWPGVPTAVAVAWWVSKAEHGRGLSTTMHVHACLRLLQINWSLAYPVTNRKQLMHACMHACGTRVHNAHAISATALTCTHEHPGARLGIRVCFVHASTRSDQISRSTHTSRGGGRLALPSCRWNHGGCDRNRFVPGSMDHAQC